MSLGNGLQVAPENPLLDAALAYISRGWSPIPVPPRSKNPNRKRWQHERWTAADAPRHFGSSHNIGVLTGEPSGWLVDVDLDHRLAVELGAEFLPPTGAIFGRAGKPSSHWLYISPGAQTVKHQIGKDTIVELRSNGREVNGIPGGLQTVFPPSVHPSGEAIAWVSDGDPAEVPAEELTRVVAALAAEVRRQLNQREARDDRTIALEALGHLAPHRADGYDSWVKVGMALRAVGDDLLPEWDRWSQQSAKYLDGEFARKWSSFGKNGVGIGSLVYWARQDSGWRPGSGHQRPRTFPACTATAADLPPSGGAQGAPAAGYDLILRHFRAKYQPTFRRGVCLYSSALGRDVGRMEALAGAGMELIDQLTAAIDTPRYQDGGVKRSGLPNFFKTWAPSAWVDLLDSLPEEEASAEIVDLAREEFRRQFASALFAQVTMSYKHRGEEETRQERRSLIDWARLLAKPGRFVGVRSHLLWVRLDEDNRLRIAMRYELFREEQRGGALAKMLQRQLSDLAVMYDVGKPVKVSGGAKRAIELDPSFIAELLAEPETPGGDGRTDTETRAHTRG